MHDYRLSDLLDMNLLQTLADSNFLATGLPMSIVDAQDKSFLVQAGWTDFCRNFHRAVPASNEICREADATVSRNLVEGEAYQYRCKFGLWHVAIPITVAERHLATMFMTQFCIEGEIPERDFYVKQAELFGYDLETYLQALDRVPVFRRERVNYIIAYDQALVRFISGLAEQSLQLKKIHAELEEKVRERTAELAQANEFMSNIFDNSVDAIGITDPRGNLIRWNRAAEEMYGFPFAELQGKPTADLYADKAELEKMLNQLRRDRFVKRYEINMRRKDGTVFPCGLSIRILRNAGDDNLGTVTVSRDLTEIKENLAKFQEANDKLQTLISSADRRHYHMSLLQEMNDFFQSCQNAAETYSAIAHYAPKFFPGYTGGLYILNNTEILFELAASWGEADNLDSGFGHEDCWALRRSRAILVQDAQTSLNCPHVTSSLPAGYLCMPLMAQGKEIGILHLQSLTPESPERMKALEVSARPVGEVLAMALANLKLRETLKDQAIRDSLTGLFNRRYLNETLERELSRGKRLGNTTSVIMLDVDHFKQYNDIYGQNAGDELLAALGNLISWQVREEDIPCRYGGEEFFILMPGAPLEAALSRAQDLNHQVKQLHMHSRTLRPVTISVGVAVFPDHGSSGREIIRATEAALQRAKAEGRDRVVVAEPVGLGKRSASR